MPREMIANLAGVDLTKAAFPIEEVRKTNPQRFEMEQLSYVAALDLEANWSVAVRKIGADEFWCRGHIPGRPIFPGVLMVEAAAQLCSFHYHKAAPEDERFFGFGGIDGVKFRGEVVPGDTLVVMAKMIEIRSRRAVFDTQAAVGGRIVFEARITGMPM
ncbi:MAG: 3-hydroxyacyl-ACP dehydratase FabZ family protein [Planctomycetota bacterium]